MERATARTAVEVLRGPGSATPASAPSESSHEAPVRVLPVRVRLRPGGFGHPHLRFEVAQLPEQLLRFGGQGAEPRGVGSLFCLERAHPPYEFGVLHSNGGIESPDPTFGFHRLTLRVGVLGPGPAERRFLLCRSPGLPLHLPARLEAIPPPPGPRAGRGPQLLEPGLDLYEPVAVGG
jgi:hypothetical protein